MNTKQYPKQHLMHTTHHNDPQQSIKANQPHYSHHTNQATMAGNTETTYELKQWWAPNPKDEYRHWCITFKLNSCTIQPVNKWQDATPQTNLEYLTSKIAPGSIYLPGVHKLIVGSWELNDYTKKPEARAYLKMECDTHRAKIAAAIGRRCHKIERLDIKSPTDTTIDLAIKRWVQYSTRNGTHYKAGPNLPEVAVDHDYYPPITADLNYGAQWQSNMQTLGLREHYQPPKPTQAETEYMLKDLQQNLDQEAYEWDHSKEKMLDRLAKLEYHQEL